MLNVNKAKQAHHNIKEQVNRVNRTSAEIRDKQHWKYKITFDTFLINLNRICGN